LFDKLIEVALQFVGLAKFWQIVEPAQTGIVLTWGKQTRTIRSDNGWFKTGLHLKAPLNVEEVYVMSTATRVEELAAQTLVTKDGRNIAAGIVVTFRVHDASKALFSVYEPFAAIHDACQANFAQLVIATDYADIPTDSFAEKLTAVCRKRGFQYGFEIDSVRIAEFAPVRTYRLMGDGAI
jgi:regulator of protease activity HflC (stomatin/prohibitin superfamily)